MKNTIRFTITFLLFGLIFDLLLVSGPTANASEGSRVQLKCYTRDEFSPVFNVYISDSGTEDRPTAIRQMWVSVIRRYKDFYTGKVVDKSERNFHLADNRDNPGQNCTNPGYGAFCDRVVTDVLYFSTTGRVLALGKSFDNDVTVRIIFDKSEPLNTRLEITGATEEIRSQIFCNVAK